MQAGALRPHTQQFPRGAAAGTSPGLSQTADLRWPISRAPFRGRPLPGGLPLRTSGCLVSSGPCLPLPPTGPLRHWELLFPSTAVSGLPRFTVTTNFILAISRPTIRIPKRGAFEGQEEVNQDDFGAAQGLLVF